MPHKPTVCVFCGRDGRLTREHVFGDWISRIGLDVSECRTGAGPLNRSVRDFGKGPPFAMRVRDVCNLCNNGWMSRLESVARRVLTPFILGRSGSVSGEDAAAIAAWVQKTALVGMLVSSKENRACGYGLPPTEYRALYLRQQDGAPLPASQLWIGRYDGQERLSSIWVTPMVVKVDAYSEPELPHAYAMTVVLGELLLHGVRFTTPILQFPLNAGEALVPLWPNDAASHWPGQTTIDDDRYVHLCKGLEITSQLANISITPWRPAVDLPRSTMQGSAVQLPTPCGEHFVFYPAELAAAAMAGRFYAFMTSCDCGKAYLVRTEADGAHFESEGPAEVIAASYEDLAGAEFAIEDTAGSFVFKYAGGLTPS